jgi:hypothetical protein
MTRPTYDELQNVAPDSDPLMKCHGCGEKHRASYYDQHGQLDQDPEKPTLCGSCVTRNEPATEQRQKNNRQLGAFL